jgi:hypothetical protein
MARESMAVVRSMALLAPWQFFLIAVELLLFLEVIVFIGEKGFEVWSRAVGYWSPTPFLAGVVVDSIFANRMVGCLYYLGGSKWYLAISGKLYTVVDGLKVYVDGSGGIGASIRVRQLAMSDAVIFPYLSKRWSSRSLGVTPK